MQSINGNICRLTRNCKTSLNNVDNQKKYEQHLHRAKSLTTTYSSQNVNL